MQHAPSDSNSPTSRPADQTDAILFAERLRHNRERIDRVIAGYWQAKLPEVQEQYGEASFRSLEAFADIMNRGGKRIRAALAETSYRMFGGQNEQLIDRMCLALEMIHAYVLVIDDICDRSDMRRGGPSVHRELERWHTQTNLTGEAQHFGTTMATLAAMTGAHEAMVIMSTLPAPAERRTAALDNLNRMLAITCHGQFNDLMNEFASVRDESRVEDVLLWKTAYYTFANPLQLGAILAGASPSNQDALLRYSLAAGRAFQISDDIIGLFGKPDQTGKTPSDDIREGKRTLLTLKALELASPDDAAFLELQLGNEQLSDSDFARCQRIIQGSGALAHVQQELEHSCHEAFESIQHGDLPAGEGVQFLRGLTMYLQSRQA